MTNEHMRIDSTLLSFPVMSMDSSHPPSGRPCTQSPKFGLSSLFFPPRHRLAPIPSSFPSSRAESSSPAAHLGFLRPMTKASRILRTSLGWMSTEERGGSFSGGSPSPRLPSPPPWSSSSSGSRADTRLVCSCREGTDARGGSGETYRVAVGGGHTSKSVCRQTEGEKMEKSLQKVIEVTEKMQREEFPLWPSENKSD